MKKNNHKKYRIMWIVLSIIAFLCICIVVFMNRPVFGSVPKKERLERVKNSLNYRDDKFQNIHETKQITSDKGLLTSTADFLFKKKERLRPETALPVIKNNLHELDRKENVLIWFGHSSYLLQVEGVRVLIDPVFCEASPVSFFNKPFKLTYSYTPEDMPEVDYLIISHDHWDHLDYKTIVRLKDKIGKIICGLGVGAHFERWGFDKNSLIELDWNENEEETLENDFTVYCLPARHFSGRSFPLNQSLWASYLIQTPNQKIYIGGDSGYDTHYAEIGNRFESIDLAILENGQYDMDWCYIHLLPEQVVQAFNDLNAKKLFTVHHSKYALGNHPWDEPLKNISSFAERDSINLILPMIGEKVNLNDSVYTINKWWETDFLEKE